MTAAMSQGKAASGTVMWMPLAGRIEWGSLPLVEGPDLVGPHAGGVDHHRGPDVEGLGRRPGLTWAPLTRAAGAGGEGGDRRVVGGHRAVVEHRGAQDGQGEPGVVGPGVPVEESGHQPVGPQGGHVGQGLGPGHLLVAPADAHPAGQVVEPQGGAVDAGHARG